MDASLSKGVTAKVIMIGASSTGKSAIILKYHDGQVISNLQSTVGCSYKSHAMSRRNQNLTLDLWDTAGQEKWAAMSTMYYREGFCCVAVFDLTNPDTFDITNKHIAKYFEVCSNPRLVIAANKADLVEKQDRQTLLKTIKEYGRKWQPSCPVFETSAVTGDGLTEMFDAIADMVIDQGISPSKPLTLTSRNQDGCCH